MDPQDDPEARIRELERPLSEEARTSEMGAAPPGGYAHPPTPPPLSYGAPFETTRVRPAGGVPWLWIMLAVFAVGALALAAGIAVFAGHVVSSGGSIIGSPGNRPTISRRNGPLTTSPHSLPGTANSGTQAPIPPGANISVTGISENRTVACNDSFVSVSGVSNRVTITGHCASLTVSGVRNMVTVDAADSIDASGFNNQVTFHSGSPSIDKSGGSNVVQRG